MNAIKTTMTSWVIALLFFTSTLSYAQLVQPGQPLPPWKEGYLDLHHINTGWGDAAFYVFPDGTTMVFDAGEMSPIGDRAFTPRNATMRPNYSKKPYQWIADYIRQVAPDKDQIKIDYAVISHFHGDHMGSFYPGAKLSRSGDYFLSGITGLGDLIKIKKLMDRGYPDYSHPFNFPDSIKKYERTNSAHSGNSLYYQTLKNYFDFINSEQKKGMEVERFAAGSRDQIKMINQSGKYPSFYVQNVKSNGLLWTGKDTSVFSYFPNFDTIKEHAPNENILSLALTINYGPFKYYTGGDCEGMVEYGEPYWRDVETPIAKSVGEVDVATLNHHGNRNSMNEFLVQTFRSRVWIEQSWSADHPGEEVLRRLISKKLYSGPRDLFTTNMLDPNKYVIGPLVDKSYKSQQGHILVRVLPGGKMYYVIILDDSRENLVIKEVFGPYQSKVNE